MVFPVNWLFFKSSSPADTSAPARSSATCCAKKKSSEIAAVLHQTPHSILPSWPAKNELLKRSGSGKLLFCQPCSMSEMSEGTYTIVKPHAETADGLALDGDELL